MTLINTSTSAFYSRSQSGMQDLRAQAEALQASIGTGQKYTAASDNPVATARLRQLGRSDTLSAIDKTNAGRATTDLQLADTALSNLASAIIRAKELSAQAANGTFTPAQRRSIGAEISSIRTSVIRLANTSDANGHALFGGQSAGAAYTTDTSGNAVYAGTASAGTLSLGDGQVVNRGVTGPEFLNYTHNGVPTDLLATLKTLADALQNADPAAQSIANASLDTLNSGLDAVTTAQSLVGSRLASIDLANDRRTAMEELRAGEEADTGGTDLAAAVTRLQETMTVLQASQASFAKLARLSLFDVLN